MKYETAFPITTVSEANKREHWAVRGRRTKSQREEANFLMRGFIARHMDIGFHKGKYRITLIRIGLRDLDTDNLAGSMKHVRDGIADALGTDDGPKGRVIWKYDQEHATERNECGVGVRVEF